MKTVRSRSTNQESTSQDAPTRRSRITNREKGRGKAIWSGSRTVPGYTGRPKDRSAVRSARGEQSPPRAASQRVGNRITGWRARRFSVHTRSRATGAGPARGRDSPPCRSWMRANTGAKSGAAASPRRRCARRESFTSRALSLFPSRPSPSRVPPAHRAPPSSLPTAARGDRSPRAPPPTRARDHRPRQGPVFHAQPPRKVRRPCRPALRRLPPRVRPDRIASLLARARLDPL